MPLPVANIPGLAELEEIRRRSFMPRLEQGISNVMQQPLATPLGGIPQEAQSPITGYNVGDLFKTGLGFAPVAGEAMSVEDALANLEQGNYGMAALSGLGALPLVGAAVKPFRAAQEAGDVFFSRLLTQMENFPKKATGAEYGKFLDAAVKKGQVKQHEVDVAGLKFLQGSDSPIEYTRDELFNLAQKKIPEPQIQRLGGGEMVEEVTDVPGVIVENPATFHEESIPDISKVGPEVGFDFSLEDYQELPVQMPPIGTTGDFSNPAHFGGMPNIAGWTRSIDYVDPRTEDIGRAIIEVQSDWAQAARQGGEATPFISKLWEDIPLKAQMADIAANPNISQVTLPAGSSIWEQWGGMINPQFASDVYDVRVPRAIEKLTGAGKGAFGAQRSISDISFSPEEVDFMQTIYETAPNDDAFFQAISSKRSLMDKINLITDKDDIQAMREMLNYQSIPEFLQEYGPVGAPRDVTLKITPEMRKKMAGPHPLFQIAAPFAGIAALEGLGREPD